MDLKEFVDNFAEDQKIRVMLGDEVLYEGRMDKLQALLQLDIERRTGVFTDDGELEIRCRKRRLGVLLHG